MYRHMHNDFSYPLPSSWDLPFSFCLWEGSHFGFFIANSHAICSRVLSLFHLAWCFQGSSMLHHAQFMTFQGRLMLLLAHTTHPLGYVGRCHLLTIVNNAFLSVNGMQSFLDQTQRGKLGWKYEIGIILPPEVSCHCWGRHCRQCQSV